MSNIETVSADVLVVGAGLAGSLAAMEAARTGAHTLLVFKSSSPRGARSNTAVAGGGFAAAFGHTDTTDNPREHFRDTVVAGGFLNDQRLVRLMVAEVLDGVRSLEALGVSFEREGQLYRQRAAPGHSHPRSVMTTGGAMSQLGQVLVQGIKGSGVEVRRGLTLAEVLTADGRVVGAACLTDDGQRLDIQAEAVILAAGGLGQVYPVTGNSPLATGDGYVCGFRAGARLRDMEFVQFTPAGLVFPSSVRGLSINHELLAHSQAQLLNARHEQLATLGPESARDLDLRLSLIRLCHREVLEGRGTQHGGVYLDVRAVPREEIIRLAPGLSDALLSTGIDPSSELLEVAPEAHFFMGGFDVDEQGMTTLSGLYAVGENAAGCHGANRLTHNAFPELLVFAPRAGRAASEHALRLRSRSRPKPDPIERMLWPTALDLRERLRATMFQAAGPVRSGRGLETGLASVRALRVELAERPLADGASLLEGLATRNMLEVAETMLLGARHREESRGSHFREDFPAQDDSRWLVNLLLDRGPNGPVLSERAASLPYLSTDNTLSWGSDQESRSR